MVVIEESNDVQNGGSTSERSSRGNNVKKKEIIKEGSGSKPKQWGISLTDLPPNILVEILTRLPLRTLFVTRSVCKSLGFLTTPDPHFINLHSSNAPQFLVFQCGGKQSPSFLLHMADHVLDYENSQLKPLFQLPKMGSPVEELWNNGQVSDYCRGANRLFLSNSCNGLLYFLQNKHDDDFLYYLQNGHSDYFRSVVCNPVTSEYILIPGVEVDPTTVRSDSVMVRSFWLGFSPGTNQYKVVRIFRRIRADYDVGAAQVFVIGFDSWRDIDGAPLPWLLCQPCYVNGFMYWLNGLGWPAAIISFDFEREKFEEVDLPPEFEDEEYIITKNEISMGVLGGCLCLSLNDIYDHCVDLWMMRKCGNRESWTKEFVFYPEGPRGEPVSGYFKPLQYLGNGELLMQWRRNTLVYCNLRTKTLRYFSLRRNGISHNVVALKPSFIPLKDALKVEEVWSQLRPRVLTDKRGYVYDYD